RTEVRHMARKHRELCEAHGRPLGSLTLSRWLLSQYRPQGRRLDAAREYALVGLRHRSPRDLGRAAGMLLGERVMRAGRALVGASPPSPAADAPGDMAPPWLGDALAGRAFADEDAA